MRRSRRPIVFGEILFDRFPDGDRRLGGAPLNVAVHLAAFGVHPLLVSRLGSDPEGIRARRELAARGVDAVAVQTDAELPTGAVEVELAGGEPRFDILADRAWDRIDAGAAAAALVGVRPSLIYHGTLAARSAGSRAALDAVRTAAATPRFVDVNLRPPWTPAARARELARGAAWLKTNRDELAVLLERELLDSGAELDAGARELVGELALGALVVTDGARGAHLYRAGGERAHVESPPVDERSFVDAVGAGDALAATLVMGALAGWPGGLALRRGVELAAAICTVPGALPADAGFYAPFLEAWRVAA